MRRALLVLPLALTGCLSPAQETQVQAAISSNASQITAFCSGDVLPLANSLAGVALASLVPQAAQARTDTLAACQAVPTVALSASTLAWMAGNVTIMKTNGKVLPPPVKPVPIAGTAAASVS